MRSITDVVRQFKQNWTEELAPSAIAQACRDAGMRWHESTLNPVVTIQIFFVQILHGNTAIEHLRHLTGRVFTASAYCQARMRISLEALQLIAERCASQVQQETFDAARWFGHRVFHVDGSSFSMPDTPTLQAYFGQSGQQKPGCGFPVAHWLVMIHAATGMITKMSQVMVEYLKFVRTYYRKYGKVTRECEQIAECCKLIKTLYGRTPAAEFGPLRLKAVRDCMIKADRSREYINKNIDRIRRMFKWAAGEELIPASVPQALAMVSGLRRGRTTARETDPVLPVEDSIVDATIEHMPTIIADTPKLQPLTGGERLPDAILLTHAHLDHCGLLDRTSSQIPVYATSGTSKMMKAGSMFARQVELPRERFRQLNPGQPTQIGNFRVTAYSVDHSIFGAVAILVEADGQSLLYSGDLRLHGRKTGMAKKLIAAFQNKKLDVLLI